MKANKNLIVILSGGLVKDGGRWRTTTFAEKNQFQSIGDRYRVLAGAELYKKNLEKDVETFLLASGGRGVTKDSEHPIIADVISDELQALGVPKENILKERKTGKTFEQLLYVQNFFLKEGFSAMKIISNRYHLPRIRVMVMYSPKLLGLKRSLIKKTITLVSAEGVSHMHVDYKSNFMRERMRAERRGVRQIKNGTYKGM